MISGLNMFHENFLDTKWTRNPQSLENTGLIVGSSPTAGSTQKSPLTRMVTGFFDGLMALTGVKNL